MQLSINHLFNGISSIFHLSFLRFAFLALILLCFKIGKSQFHPSISPVLRSTTFGAGDFIIRDDGHAVVASIDMFVGIVDTVTKEILYDTSYFRPSCPFGVNGFARLIEHPKGGYVGAGLLGECNRDQAILLWMNDTLAEVSSFLTPSGFQGNSPYFIDVEIDKQLERVYALKRFELPLWTTGKKPLILYTLTDSLDFISTDTIADDYSGVPQVDFNINENLMVLSYRTESGNETVLNLVNVENGSIISADTFLYPTLIADVHFFEDRILTMQSEILSLTGKFLKINNFIRAYDFNINQSKELKISGTESYVAGNGSGFISKGNKLSLIYESRSPYFDGIDSVLKVEGKAMFLSENLDIVNEIEISPGPSYSLSQNPSSYSIEGINLVTADDSYFYYNLLIQDSTSSQLVFYSNRVSMDYVLKTDEIGSEEAKFSIYPNPATDYIRLSVSGLEPASIQITDISGKVFFNTPYKPLIDISTLPKGSYIMSSYSKSGVLLSSNLFIH